MDSLINGIGFINILAILATSVAAGFLGVFLVMRRMSLVSDALSHVALPGLALALLWNIQPFFGAFAFLLVGIVLIYLIQQRTNLPADAIVGVLFTASLAVGILLTPEPELLEALFGDFTKISSFEAWTAIIVSLLVLAGTIFSSRTLMFSIAAPDLGHVSKARLKTVEFIFLVMVALIVALGIKFVGTLLMGTLTIIPAAAAKNISKSFAAFCVSSIVIAALSVFLGLAASYWLDILAGPAVILAGVFLFLLTLVSKRA
ncbi:MAG: hypothetical protein A3C11_03060 [Candidatus Sungbacteria bacterium RIFCSPHIGHO2_02_FULL_49_12]|uniref:High-affinity zinc uptake system membrane protein ZnuB n=1 Tax=Candidatus Sungbacteria bacterium RIFCSPHIGHO2_02_FULL_49_12 TaxID=1802271 RepID=A0A1G2KQI9_9BACT|nr:MAG: hypothetical protein A3C11_03060 [Candidatus Sungbacteria bacterium RIFCSPHIGHO2_02_FULL_49_12]